MATRGGPACTEEQHVPDVQLVDERATKRRLLEELQSGVQRQMDRIEKEEGEGVQGARAAF